MSERDELRERLIFLFHNPPSDDAGEKADAVLAEIERTHVLVPRDTLSAALDDYEVAATCVRDAGTVRQFERWSGLLRRYL